MPSPDSPSSGRTTKGQAYNFLDRRCRILIPLEEVIIKISVSVLDPDPTIGLYRKFSRIRIRQLVCTEYCLGSGSDKWFIKKIGSYPDMGIGLYR